MEIELKEIRDFLASRPPFNALSSKCLDELPQALQVRYLRRGLSFPPENVGGNFLYIVRSGAIEIFGSDGKLLEKLGEGDCHTVSCQLVDFENIGSAQAAEDSLLYLLPCALLTALRKESPEFSQHFNESMRERMKAAVAALQDTRPCNDMAQLQVEVRTLLSRPAVTLDMRVSIREAACVMSEQAVSSAMLMDGTRLAGLVTDRDLRKRCLAEGLSVQTAVADIMTKAPICIQADRLALQALMTMTRLHIHHLPVMSGDQVIGMLTATDLTKLQSANPAYIATDIRKAQSLADLTKALQRLADLQMQLANASASALHIGEVISSITDSLTCRLLEMAEQKLGEPPVPYLWLCGGSQARMEQSAHSDQDNALVLSDMYQEAHADYFEQLARFVTDGLNACGFVYCPGDAMASNPQWRQPLATWLKYFHNWISTPDPKALMLSSIFFDLRPVFGDFSLFHRLQKSVLKGSRENGIFIAYLASNALTHRPPLGFFRSFVLIHDGKHDDTLDIKHRGIVPITDIARLLALEAGIGETNTSARLRALAGSASLSNEMADNLIDALEFIASLRINHQAAQMRKGQQPNNYLPPAELSELQRKHLKDAFKIIESMQETLDRRYQTSRFR